jgi:hypothetical protein
LVDKELQTEPFEEQNILNMLMEPLNLVIGNAMSSSKPTKTDEIKKEESRIEEKRKE